MGDRGVDGWIKGVDDVIEGWMGDWVVERWMGDRRVDGWWRGGCVWTGR